MAKRLCVCVLGENGVHSQGELDPVAESSEEVDANNGRFETKPELLQEYLGPGLQGPRKW